MAERSTFWVGLKSAEVYIRGKRFLSPASRFAARRKSWWYISYLFIGFTLGVHGNSCLCSCWRNERIRYESVDFVIATQQTHRYKPVRSEKPAVWQPLFYIRSIIVSILSRNRGPVYSCNLDALSLSTLGSCPAAENSAPSSDRMLKTLQ